MVLKDTTSLTSGMDLSRHARTLRQGPAQARGPRSWWGHTAASLDLQEVPLRRFPMLVVLILGRTGLMLAIVFRSVLVPIKAVIMNTSR
ncbi:MAG: hypothetical protein IPJ57_20350 [Gemmatimonadetes bacterium]|nr:hypothetical protein [Gemmatimonadota bacterium]